jgi:hypothetical protein
MPKPLPVVPAELMLNWTIRGLNHIPRVHMPYPNIRRGYFALHHIPTWKPSWDAPKTPDPLVPLVIERFDENAEIDGTKMKTPRIIEEEMKYVTKTALNMAETLREAILTETTDNAPMAANAGNAKFPRLRQQFLPRDLPDHPAVVAAALAQRSGANVRTAVRTALGVGALPPTPDSFLHLAITAAIANNNAADAVIQKHAELAAARADAATAGTGQAAAIAALGAQAAALAPRTVHAATGAAGVAPAASALDNAITAALANSQARVDSANAARMQSDREMQRLMKVVRINVDIASEIVNQMEKLQGLAKIERDLRVKNLVYIMMFGGEWKPYADAANRAMSKIYSWGHDADPGGPLGRPSTYPQ